MTRGRELLMRWEEMNAFSPLMRSHEGNQPSRSVQFDADAQLLEHLARCVQLHVALKPYITALEEENAKKGIPLIRPLFYYYPEDWTWTEKFTYLLGRDLLVAPVITEGATTRTVMLPKDRWVHLWSKKEFAGGPVNVNAPLGQIPVFLRRESVWYDLLMGTLSEKQ